MILNIEIKNRIARYIEGDEIPVCGNGSDTVEFTFDAEWEGRDPKVARFIWGNQFHDEPFTGNTCPVPMILNARGVEIGVFVEANGTQEAIASTRTWVDYHSSIRCGNAEPAEMDVEAYTNEAKAAAMEAQEAAKECKAIEDDMAYTKMRISSIEDHLDIADPFVEMTNPNGVNGTIVKFAEAHKYQKYAKILKLWGTYGITAYDSHDKEDLEPDFPQYLVADGKRIYKHPAVPYINTDDYRPNRDKINAIAQDYGYDPVNYIYTVGEKWFYHQGGRFYESYITDSGDAANIKVKADESGNKWWWEKGGYFNLLKEPIVTDITDKIAQSPYIDIEDITKLTIQNARRKEMTISTNDEIYDIGQGSAYATVGFEA